MVIDISLLMEQYIDFGWCNVSLFFGFLSPQTSLSLLLKYLEG